MNLLLFYAVQGNLFLPVNRTALKEEKFPRQEEELLNSCKPHSIPLLPRSNGAVNYGLGYKRHCTGTFLLQIVLTLQRRWESQQLLAAFFFSCAAVPMPSMFSIIFPSSFEPCSSWFGQEHSKNETEPNPFSLSLSSLLTRDYQQGRARTANWAANWMASDNKYEDETKRWNTNVENWRAFATEYQTPEIICKAARAIPTGFTDPALSAVYACHVG